MPEQSRLSEPLQDLIQFVDFTQHVGTRIHGVLDEAEVYRTVGEEFLRSERYGASIVLLTDDGDSLTIAASSETPRSLKAGEKATGLRMNEYRIDLHKSRIYSRVVKEGQTIQVQVTEILAELFPRPVVALISKIMGYRGRPDIVTPLSRHGKVVGALAVSSPVLAPYFIPSVRTLAQHISTALELADEYAERRQAEEALRDSQQMLQIVLDSIPAGVFWKDRDSIYLGGNRTFLQAAGLESLEEVIGRSDYDLSWEKEQADSFREVDRKVIESGTPQYGIVEPFLQGNGTYAWAKTNKVPLRDTEGNVVGILGTYEDITGWVQAEEALRESEERHRTLFERVPVGLYRTTPDGHILDINQALLGMLGFPDRGTALAANAADGYLNPEEHARWQAMMDREGVVRDFEVQWCRRDGTIIWVEESSQAVRDASGRVLYYEGAVVDITERKRAEETLRESEEQYRRIVETACEGIWILDAENKTSFANSRMAEMLGYSVDEMAGKPLFAFMDEEWKAIAAGNVERRRRGVTEQHDFKFRRKDGTELWAIVATNPIFDKEGRYAGTLGMITDITERKRTEEALRRREQEIRVIAENVPALFSYVGGDGRYRFVNKRYEEWFGVPRTEIVGKHYRQVVGEATYEKIEDRVGAALSGERVRYEDSLPYARGGTRWVFADYVPDTDDEGKVNGFFALVTDITERKRMEQALRESEERFRAIFEQAADSIVLIDAETGALVEFNERARENLGYTREEFAGLKIADFEVIESADAVLKHLEKVVKRGAGTFETKHRRKDGETRDILVSSRTLRIGGKAFVQGIWRDITERKRTEEALHRSLEETARGQRLLLALSEAAQRVQRARTSDEVYRTIGEEISKVGYHATIFTLTDDRAYLAVSHVTFASKLLRAAERLTGLSARGYRFLLEPAGFFERLVVGGEPVFIDPGVGPIAETLPGPVRPLAGRVAALFGIEKAIYAPLQVGGETQSLLTVIGAQLTEADVPAMVAFANQAAIAVENVQLFEQVEAGRERMRRLARQVISAQEEERRHISQELHDELGQSLTAISFDLAALEKELPPEVPPALKGRLAEARALADRVDERVSEISLDLRPSMLDDLGLVPTLRWYADRYARRLGIEVQMEALGLEERLSPEVESTLYRVVQEALTNVARHAQARKVRLRLEREASAVAASIEDDGQGFDVGELAGPPGVERGAGLAGIRGRVSSLGGSFSIQSHPGEGTRLAIEIPIQD